VKTSIILLLSLILLIPHATLPKSRFSSVPQTPTIPSRIHAQTLEERFRPFIESRLKNQRYPHQFQVNQIKNPTLPFDMEIMLLAKMWSSLSDEFKRSYTSSLLFPDSFAIYNSPGGHFEIYYTIKGPDSVSTDDTYGYSTSPPYVQTSQPNGIPDYIDETAWALDSTWRMEIIRFGLPQPYPYKDSVRSSDKYKVLIQSPGKGSEDVYGYTLFYQRVNSHSFSSFITIRNEWSAFKNEPLKYDDNPAAAVRVTCAHEFFHAIQYGMTWDMKRFGATIDSAALDDFPITWTEGCAVTMEELTFPDVNDYVQYTLPYFSKPTISFFPRNSSYYDQVYLQSLFMIYETTRIQDSISIVFPRQMYLNNFEALQPFKENITRSVVSTGYTWPQLLNKFHTASFFTGSRTDTSRFIADANKFPAWEIDSDGSGLRTINENAVGIYGLKHKQSHYDTLFLQLQPYPVSTVPVTADSWAASILLRSDTATSIITTSLDKYGRTSLTIPEWKTKTECIVTVSSGFSDTARQYSVDFTPCKIMHDSGSVDTVYMITNSKLKPYSVIEASAPLHCELTISSGSMTNKMASAAILNNIQLADSLFDIDFPLSWGTNSKISLNIDSLPNKIALYKWDLETSRWNQVSNSNSHQEHFSSIITSDGTFGFFAEIQSTGTRKVIAFPNPQKVNYGNGTIVFEGYNIKSAAVYSPSGKMVYQVPLDQIQENSSQGIPQHFVWTLRTKQGTPVAPGIYTLITKHSSNNKTSTDYQKLLLLP
jgi:hypothetical protein